eukprot:1157079-Pelagomonas_calceolata.AAC.10
MEAWGCSRGMPSPSEGTRSMQACCSSLLPPLAAHHQRQGPVSVGKPGRAFEDSLKPPGCRCSAWHPGMMCIARHAPWSPTRLLMVFLLFVQVEAAEVFVQITRERLMSPADLQACLLPTVVRHINKEKSEEENLRSCGACLTFIYTAWAVFLQETEAWVSALCELIPVLDKETLKSQVMSMALSKGDMEDNASSRVICARILGACAPYLVSSGKQQPSASIFVLHCLHILHFSQVLSCISFWVERRAKGIHVSAAMQTKDEIERSFFKKAMAMCQDVDYNVRLSMCEQLPHIGRACGKDSALNNLLVELFELLKDEELKVSCKGLVPRALCIMLLAHGSP